IGNEQCCQLPSMSTNFRSIISASCFLASAKKSSGVIEAPPVSCGAAAYETGAWGGNCGENVRRSISDLAEIDGRRRVCALSSVRIALVYDETCTVGMLLTSLRRFRTTDAGAGGAGLQNRQFWPHNLALFRSVPVARAMSRASPNTFSREHRSARKDASSHGICS